MIRELRIPILVLAAISGVATITRAQQSAADTAWAVGDYIKARANYEQVLKQNPASVRANYRLGILASWDGKLDSALVLIRRAVAEDPGDLDIKLTEATVLGWGSRYAEADSVYQDMLLRDPANRDAAAGRAQLLAWQGDLDKAVDAYQAVLARQPDNIKARVGLGMVYVWQDKLDLAGEQSAKALNQAPTDREALDLARTVRRTGRPEPEITLGWSHDSDHNTTWWQTVAASMRLGNSLRGFGSLGAMEASDQIRNSTRLSAEAGAILGISDWRLTAALGLRQLLPDGASNRTEGTYRASAAYQFNRSAGAVIGYSHVPFDETALLMTRNLDIDALDVSLDLKLRPDLSLGAGAGETWFSDNNSRTHGILALTKTLRPNLTAGLFTRIMGYDFPGFGYFSPDRFFLLEGRGSYGFTRAPWHGRVSAGLGIQQVGKGANAQMEGHVDGRVGRNWSGENTVDVFAGFSTSAESSTTGAFRYYTAGVIVRIVF